MVLSVHKSSGRPGFDPRLSLTKKWYLMPPSLTLCIIRTATMVKWSNPANGVVSSHTPLRNSYLKYLNTETRYCQIITTICT